MDAVAIGRLNSLQEIGAGAVIGVDRSINENLSAGVPAKSFLPTAQTYLSPAGVVLRSQI